MRGVLAVLLSGCSLLNAFPDPTDERTPELCADGLDDDVDGAIDCADPSCDGSCFENTEEQCADGRDNDGDGRLDVQDPTCWPFAEVSVERCSSVGATEFVATFDDPIEVAATWYAAYGELAVTSSGALDLRSNQDIGTRAIFWNPWDGLELRMMVDDLRGLIISFAPEDLAPVDRIFAPGARELMSIALYNESFRDCSQLEGWVDPEVDCPLVEQLRATARVDGTEILLGLGEYAVGRQAIVVRIDDGAASIRIDGFAELQTSEFELDLSRLAPPPPFRILLSDIYSAQTIDEVSLTTKEVRPCEVSNPQIPPGGIVGDPMRDFDVGATLGTAIAPDGVACVIALSCEPEAPSTPLRFTSWRSEDGRSWERSSVDFRAGFSTAGIIWNELEDWWEVVVPAIGADDERLTGELEVAYSRDCREWNRLAITAFPYWTYKSACSMFDLVAEASSYVVRDGPDGPRRELFNAGPMVTCPSLFDCPTIWVLQRAELRDAEWVPLKTWTLEELGIAPPVHVSAIGSDLVAIFHVPPSDGSGLGMMVWSGDAEWRRVPSFRFEPSRIPGTFDSADALSGSLFERGGELQLLYGGVGDYFVHPVTGPGHVSIGIAPVRVAE